MKDINKAILIGRLGSDPIQRQTKSGVPVTHFSVATTRRILKDRGDETSTETETSPIEETQWHRIVAWGRQAEACSHYLKKGNSVYIEGQMRSHTYENKEGKSNLCFEIQAETVSFLGGRRSEEGKSVENSRSVLLTPGTVT